MIKLKNHSHIKKYNRKASNKYWRLPDLFNNKFDKNNNKETEEIKINATLDLHRRQVLKLMGASIAVTGIGVACRRPESKILSYSKQPEDVIPGISNYFATAMPRADGALGLVVESHEGKPTKIEGNAKHSSSYGASDFWSQASILELYDPDRSRNPINRINGNRKLSVWSEFEQFSNSHFSKFIKSKGVGLSFLTGVDDSPTALRLKKVIARKFTKSSWYVHDQLYNNNTKIGTYSFFGKNTRVCYNFDKAKIIFALQADSLMVGPNHLKNAYGFGLGRKIYKGKDFNKMNRLYVAEAGYTVTGSNADHRLPISASDSLLFLKSLALELFMNLGLKWPDGVIGSKNDLIESINHGVIFNNIFIKELAKDLIKNKDRSLIVIGENQDPIVHSLGHLLNLSLGGLGKTFSIFTIDKYSWDTESFKNIVQLTNDVNNGLVNTLVIIDSNPAYNSSYKLNFVNCLKSIKYTIHCGLYDDETAKLCDWHLPMSHFLESWGDTRAYSGEASIIQPLIYPIHNSKSKFEFLFLLANNFHKDGYYLVRETWKKIFNKKLFSIKTWEKALHDGIIEDTVFKVKRVSYFDILRLIDSLKDNNCLQINEQNLELIFENDYSLADGRFSNISWLQEMPDPISKLSWSNALYISPALAKFLGLKSRIIKRVYSSQIVRLEIGNKYLELPTFILPGLNGYSLSVSLGYGRKSSGYIGNKIGVNAYNFLPKDGKKVISGVNISLTKQFVELASTQEQFSMNAGVIQEINTFSMNGRDPVRHADLMQYKNNPNYVKNRSLPEHMMKIDKVSGELKPVQMTKSWQYNTNKWGMVIDLTACIGCNACVIACQAENNIPVVGKEEVKKGRIMHWLRVDRYFTGNVNQPNSVAQPVPCMQCENAPCEPVCPVSATAHDSEGLNTMAYNRCIGTRYCANNCPYKVRRFNYFDFSNSGNIYVDKYESKRQELLKMQKNPNVTIRYRGVMEKCTYCTQRISNAKINARKNGKDPSKIVDGQVVPACAQSCPTKAIIFGNLNDEESKVVALKKTDRNYDLLDELNVRPRTSYLSKIRNSNPKLV